MKILGAGWGWGLQSAWIQLCLKAGCTFCFPQPIHCLLFYLIIEHHDASNHSLTQVTGTQQTFPTSASTPRTDLKPHVIF